MKKLAVSVFVILVSLPRGSLCDNASGEKIDFMSGYWRSFYAFSPAPVDLDLLRKHAAADPEGHLSKKIAKKRIDLGRPVLDWPFYHVLGHSLREYCLRPTPVPEGWAKPEFDDSLWPRQRRPLLTGWTRLRSQAVGLACFRARFIVVDPEKIENMTLALKYRGGAAVYVNGVEVARGHLPAGPLGEDTPAEVYSRSAYALPPMANTAKLKAAVAGKKKLESHMLSPRPLVEVWGAFRPTREDDPVASMAKLLNTPVSEFAQTRRVPDSPRAFFYTRQERDRIRDIRRRRVGPVRIDRGLLRKGVNVLAVRIHRSPVRPDCPVGWLHAYLHEAVIRCRPSGAVRPERLPAGVRIWSDDIHRRYFERDIGPEAEPVRPIRIVGAKNGVYSGQAVVEAGTEISGITAGMSDLAGSAGARIAASAVRIRYGRAKPILGIGVRKLSANAQGGKGMEGRSKRLAKARYAAGVKMPAGLRGSKVRLWRERFEASIHYYDHLTPDPPGTLAPGTCLPVWVTFRVPKTAAPGGYQGVLSVKAGKKDLQVPVRLRVMDWTVPDPEDFTTVMALEPSPYGVAKHYEVAPWSDEHFEFMEPSFKLAGELGNDLVVVPVLAESEFGNLDDSIVRWRKSGNGYQCDVSRLPRFLNLVNRHLKPRCVCFVVCHTYLRHRGKSRKTKWPWRVPAADGAEDRPCIDVPAPGTPEALRFWKPFVDGVKKVMADRGLAESLHWGWIGDTIRDDIDGTIRMFSKLAPDTGWVRAAHGWEGPKSPYSFGVTVRCTRCPARKLGVVKSRKGWKNTWLKLVFTRVENPTAVVYGFSSPLRYRIAPEAAITGGADGIGRWALDCWGGVFQTRDRISSTVLSVLWPGPRGAQGGARFECLREGLQEAEARIFLERKLEENGASGTSDGRSVQKILDSRLRRALVYQVQTVDTQEKLEEYYGGWQESSWDLYAAAARMAGGTVPSEEEKKRFFGR